MSTRKIICNPTDIKDKRMVHLDVAPNSFEELSNDQLIPPFLHSYWCAICGVGIEIEHDICECCAQSLPTEPITTERKKS